MTEQIFTPSSVDPWLDKARSLLAGLSKHHYDEYSIAYYLSIEYRKGYTQGLKDVLSDEKIN